MHEYTIGLDQAVLLVLDPDPDSSTSDACTVTNHTRGALNQEEPNAVPTFGVQTTKCDESLVTMTAATCLPCKSLQLW